MSRQGAGAIAVVRLVLHGFDMHVNQAARPAALLARLAEGLASLRGALMCSGIGIARSS